MIRAYTATLSGHDISVHSCAYVEPHDGPTVELDLTSSDQYAHAYLSPAQAREIANALLNAAALGDGSDV